MTRTSRRPELVFAAVGALLIAGVIASVIIGVAGHRSSGSGEAARSIPTFQATPVATEEAPVPTATATVTATVDPADVRAVLDQYATAYDDEDTSELRQVLADTVSRTSDGDQTDGIDDVLDAYQQQFDSLDYPTYTLSSITVTPEDGAATASASYSITADNADEANGTIGFHLVETDYGLLIDAIAAQPD